MKFLSIGDCAAKVGCSRKTIERLITEKRIKAINFGSTLRRKWRVPEVNFEAFLNGESTEAGSILPALNEEAAKPEWLGGNKTSA